VVARDRNRAPSTRECAARRVRAIIMQRQWRVIALDFGTRYTQSKALRSGRSMHMLREYCERLRDSYRLSVSFVAASSRQRRLFTRRSSGLHHYLSRPWKLLFQAPSLPLASPLPPRAHTLSESVRENLGRQIPPSPPSCLPPPLLLLLRPGHGSTASKRISFTFGGSARSSRLKYRRIFFHFNEIRPRGRCDN